jgi:hypothetical protein
MTILIWIPFNGISEGKEFKVQTMQRCNFALCRNHAILVDGKEIIKSKLVSLLVYLLGVL